MNLRVPPPTPGPLTVKSFTGFLHTRPDGERWELIDGNAVMMTPPVLDHQRIGRNLMMLLVRAIDGDGGRLEVVQEVGVLVPGLGPSLLVPDLVVTAPVSSDYCRDLELAVEIDSPSNRRGEIEAKLERYRSLPSARYCLVVELKRIRCRLSSRANGWTTTTLAGPDARLVLPEFGFDHALVDIYRGTAALTSAAR